MTSPWLRNTLLTLIAVAILAGISLAIYQKRAAYQAAADRFAEIIHDHSPSAELKQEAMDIIRQHPLIAHMPGSISWATRHGDDQMCRLFLDAGGDPNDTTGERAVPPLLYACSRKDPEMVKLLIQHGANVNVVLKFDPEDDTDSTLLHMAVFYGNLEICQELVAAGADVNAADVLGETPLFVAVRKGKPAIAELLLTHGATCQANKQGTTLEDVLDNPPEGEPKLSDEVQQKIRALLDKFCQNEDMSLSD